MDMLLPRAYLEWCAKGGDELLQIDTDEGRDMLRYFTDPAWQQALDIVCHGVGLINQFQQRKHSGVYVKFAVDPCFPTRGRPEWSLCLEYDMLQEVGNRNEREWRQLYQLTHLLVKWTIAELNYYTGYRAFWSYQRRPNDLYPDDFDPADNDFDSHRWTLVIHRPFVAAEPQQETAA